MIRITKEEFTQFKNIAIDPGLFAQKFKVYLGVKNQTIVTSDDNKELIENELVLVGYQLVGNDYKVVEHSINNTTTKTFSDGNI